MPSTIAAGKFKAKCLRIIDEVAETRETLVVTKHGRPMVLITPIPAEYVDPFGALRGSGVIVGDIISPLENEWEAAQ